MLEPQPVWGVGTPRSPSVPPGIRSASAALVTQGASPFWEMLLAPEAQTLDQQ